LHEVPQNSESILTLLKIDGFVKSRHSGRSRIESGRSKEITLWGSVLTINLWS